MVRLVFRPYTQIRRSICTSEPLRASTRVSSGFTLFRHSSPSFGSQHICSYSRHRGNNRARSMLHLADHTFSLSLRIRVCHPNTRIYVRLLGPCFKTGRLKPFRQHPKRQCDTPAVPFVTTQHLQAVTKRNSQGDRFSKRRCSPQSNPGYDSKL